MRKRFIFCILSNLIYWNFNVFASSVVSSYDSFNTSSFLCEYRINHCIEFIIGQEFLVFFFPRGFIYRSCQSNVWSLVILIIFTNQPSKMTELKDCKNYQENVSLSLAEEKLDEKNEWKFSNQSGEVMYASIYLTNRRRSFDFFVSLW